MPRLSDSARSAFTQPLVALSCRGSILEGQKSGFRNRELLVQRARPNTRFGRQAPLWRRFFKTMLADSRLFMPRIFSLSIRARERASRLTANCPPIFSIWFENCRDQTVRAGESGIQQTGVSLQVLDRSQGGLRKRREALSGNFRRNRVVEEPGCPLEPRHADDLRQDLQVPVEVVFDCVPIARSRPQKGSVLER